MIKSAIVFFEHQLPLIETLVPMLESKHPVWIIDESLNVDLEPLKNNYPEFRFTKVSVEELSKTLRRERIRQSIVPYPPKTSSSLKLKSLKVKFLNGTSQLLSDYKKRLLRSIKTSSAHLAAVSTESLRRSNNVLINDYEELVMGGLCLHRPQADITRAPKLPVRQSPRPAFEFSHATHPFRPLRGALELRSGETSNSQAAQFFTETIGRRS
jgi:hypothetical protein